MTRTKDASSPQLYASLLSQIKHSIEEAHADALPLLKDILDTIEKENINIEEMCNYSGRKAYYHNRYLVNVFYLTLGECYDSEICPKTADHDLALKYYSLSNQSPAKWRRARLYITDRVPADKKVSVVKLIVDAINILVMDDQYNQRFFGKRLEYLADMYADLYELNQQPQTYFDILRWVVENKQNVRGEHQETICRLLEFDVECGSVSDSMTLDEFSKLLN